MRTKHLILILSGVILTTIIFIVFGPAGEPNDSFKNIVSQTHQQFKELQENLRSVTEKKKLEIDPKYLAILGFVGALPPKNVDQYHKYTVVEQPAVDGEQQQQQQLSSSVFAQQLEQKAQRQAADKAVIELVALQKQQQQQKEHQEQNLAVPELSLMDARGSVRPLRAGKPHHVTTTPYNGTKSNFTIVTYAQDGQAPSAILLAQNIALKFPNEYLLIYDLGLSEEEARAVSAYCNSSKCMVINYDLSVFPSYVSEQRTHAYRPIVIKDALMRSKSILFAENYMRIRGTSRNLAELQSKVLVSGVLGWNTAKPVSSRTHPKMFEYFQTVADNFYFLRMIDLDVVLFTDTLFVTEKILLPWIKCALTLECIDPIGAQSNGCKFNKKPLYRYSGCHGYDASAFNIVLGQTWHLDDSKYSLPSDTLNIFYKETLEQATKILENRRRNSSETSDHPFTEE